MKRFISKLRDEKGQNLVEFALVLIVLLLIVYGITEFGYAWYRADKLKNAANIAARTAAVTKNLNAARAAAERVESGMGAKVQFFPNPLFTNATSVRAVASERFQTVVPGILPMLSNITELRRDATYRLEQ